jgi:hypothetical protein
MIFQRNGSTNMLREDERMQLIAMICLHGFDLWERYDKSDSQWRPLLIGQFVADYGGGPLYESVFQWKLADQISDRRSLTAISKKDLKACWTKLTDHQLSEFHKTVISTC